MRLGFELQIALFAVLAVIVPKRPLYVDRVGIVSLDEVRVVAVHCAHERCQRAQQTFGGSERRKPALRWASSSARSVSSSTGGTTLAPELSSSIRAVGSPRSLTAFTCGLLSAFVLTIHQYESVS